MNDQLSHTDTQRLQPCAPFWFWTLLILATGFFVICWSASKYLIQSRIGLEIWLVSISAIEILPFVPLIVLAQLGTYSTQARLWSLGYWLILAVAISAVAIGMISTMIIGPDLFEQFQQGQLTLADLKDSLPPGGTTVTVKAAAVMLVSVMAGLFTFTQNGRNLAARWLPIEKRSFTQTSALAITIVLLFASFLPLLILNKLPPTNVERFVSDPEIKQLLDSGLVRRLLYYRLFWALPIAFLAAGFPITRTLANAMRRLGLDRLNITQFGWTIGISIGLFFAALGLDLVVKQIWQHFQWPMTDEASMKDLVKSLQSISGALTVGIVAGVSEELAFRGLLQPRIGLLLANLLFAGVHAWQYHWDGVFGVFMIGLACGIVRTRINTTASIIVHGLYDTLVVLAVTYRWFE